MKIDTKTTFSFKQTVNQVKITKEITLCKRVAAFEFM